jgi:ribosomal protein S12 methylthiotransferase accessory factor
LLQHYHDLFERPGFYQPQCLAVDGRLARDISQIIRTGALPIYRYECCMPGSAVEAGDGLSDPGINMGFGASYSDPSEALVKSIAESYERKYGKSVDEQKLVTATRKELGSEAVDPSELTLISPWEWERATLPYVPYCETVPLDWYPCQRMEAGAFHPTLIPASLIILQFAWTRPAQRIAPILSLGLASHATYREAALNGLLEVIERDAFMRAWLAPHRPLTRLMPTAEDFSEARELVTFLTSLDFKIRFVDLTCDTHVPVVLATIENDRLPWDGVVVPGLGCHPDPARALRKALLEASVALENYVSLDMQREEIRLEVPSSIGGLPAAEYFHRVRRTLATSGQCGLDQLPDCDRGDAGKNLEHLVSRITAQGRGVYLADLTPMDATGTAPLCLMRVLVSDMQPMVYESDCWRLNYSRLFASPAGTAPEPNAKDFERLNLLPHPFMIWG